MSITPKQMIKQSTGFNTCALAASAGLIHQDAGASDSLNDVTDYGKQYYKRMLTIMENIRRTEMYLIGDISGSMAESL